MKNSTALNFNKTVVIAVTIAVGIFPITSRAQDRLKTMPGYDQYQKMSTQIPASVKVGSLSVKWLGVRKAFEYSKDAKSYRYDLATNAATEAGVAPTEAEGG